MNSFIDYQRFSEKSAKEAGAFALKHIGRIRNISYKGRMNLFTDVDTKCEKLILNGIKKNFPGHGILSEEAGIIGSRSSRYCWLIDPLDGTTNYCHSFPFYCVSIALMKDGEVITGVVYDPERDELFSACRNRGAFLNRKRIKASRIGDLSKSLLATGFPYRLGKAMRRNIDNFRSFMLKAQAVRRAGSAALDLCYVAMGRFDGFWELDLNPWDTAAAALIVEEAGGKVTTFKGERFNPFIKEIVASNSRIHKKMLTVLK